MLRPVLDARYRARKEELRLDRRSILSRFMRTPAPACRHVLLVAASLLVACGNGPAADEEFEQTNRSPELDAHDGAGSLSACAVSCCG